MAYRCRHQPLPDPPHLTREQLVARLSQRLGGLDDQGHRVWHGAHSCGVPVIRVRAPTRSLCLSVRRALWWLAHGEWLGAGTELRTTCGRADCTALDHLRAEPRAGPDLSADQVAEARRMYQAGLSDADHDGIRRTSAVSMAAWQLGLSPDTVRRVAKGARVDQSLWLTEEVDVDRVRQVLAGKQEVAKARATQAEGRWTSNRLAAHFGVTRSRMAEVLGELTSRRVRVGARPQAGQPARAWTPPPPPPPPPRPAPKPQGRPKPGPRARAKAKAAATSTPPYQAGIVPVCRKPLPPE